MWGNARCWWWCKYTWPYCRCSQDLKGFKWKLLRSSSLYLPLQTDYAQIPLKYGAIKIFVSVSTLLLPGMNNCKWSVCKYLHTCIHAYMQCCQLQHCWIMQWIQTRIWLPWWSSIVFQLQQSYLAWSLHNKIWEAVFWEMNTKYFDYQYFRNQTSKGK